MPLYAPCFLRKTSTCAEMTTMRSHIYYVPRVLRMTVGVGFIVPSEHTNPAGWPCGIEQNPTKTALAVFDVGIEKLCLNQKHCADLVTSEQPSPLGWLARNVVDVATYCSHFRARRSFAEKKRCIQRHKSSLLFDLHWPRCTVRSKTETCDSRLRDMRRV